MRGKAGRSTVVLLILLIGSSSGCSGDRPDSDARPENGDSTRTNDSSGVADDDPQDPGSDPLDEYLGEGAVSFVNGMTVDLGGATSPEADLERRRLHQEHVAECMREAGFDYIEFVPTAAELSREIEEAYRLSDEEFLAEYGYGISTIDRTRNSIEDPNDEIVAAMSPGERSAYNEALYGVDIDVPDDERAELEAGKGCSDWAVRQLNEELDLPYDESDVELLMEELSALQFRIQYEPRVVEAERRWAECMHDAGIAEVASMGDGEVAVRNRWNEDTNNVEGEDRRDPDPEALTQLQNYEIEVATADHSCREEFFNETFDVVVNELEEEFVEDHEELLNVFRAAHGTEE